MQKAIVEPIKCPRVGSAIMLLILLVAVGQASLSSPHSTNQFAASFSIPSTNVTNLGGTEISNTLDGYFIENRGQVNELVRYYSGGNPSIAFRDDGIMFVLREDIPWENTETSHAFYNPAGPIPDENIKVKSLAYMLRFEGANRVTPIGLDRLRFNTNFFIGNEPDAWRTDVPNYGEVVYRNLYDGIDLVYYPSLDGMKYDFIVGAGADVQMIRLSYDGIESLWNDKGDVVIQTKMGSIRDSAPYSYQDNQGGRQTVGCSNVVHDSFTQGFRCEGLDTSRTLVIDPLIYSTFLGGNDYDRGYSIAADDQGNAYVFGKTTSIDFPTVPGSYETTLQGEMDVFIAKLEASGSALGYSTYLGGYWFESSHGITIDHAGDVYVTGWTGSADFPSTPGAYDTLFNGIHDVFVARLNSTGNALVFSTFLGGSTYDMGIAIALAPSGEVYVGGHTDSVDFPVTPKAFDTSLNGSDAFIAKLDANGRVLLFSTYLGGSNAEATSDADIAVDSTGNVYMIGETTSADFPITPNAFDSIHKSHEVFVSKLSRNGSILLYSTFLGGSSIEYGRSIAVDTGGNAYVCGTTSSSDFPTTAGAFDTTLNWSEAFVTKLNETGSGLIYSTFIGGSLSNETCWGLAIDAVGNAFITGVTASADYPITPGALNINPYGTNAFITQLNVSGDRLLYSAVIGGSSLFDHASSIATDSSGNSYTTGYTSSSDFPVTPTAFDTTLEGSFDAFIVKILHELPDLMILPTDIDVSQASPITVDTLVTIDSTVHNIGTGNASQVLVRFYDGPPGSNQIGSDQNISFIGRQGGAETISVSWVATPVGTHDICVAVDPIDTIVETNETNNIACRTIVVEPSPFMKPDYVPTHAEPSALAVIALSSNLSFSVVVQNIGNATSGNDSILAFYDETSPTTPFSISYVSPVNPGEDSPRFTATWSSPTVPGTYEVSAFVDYYNNISESNETNNVYTWTIAVVAGPNTSLIVGSPNYTALTTYITSSTPLSFSILDQGGTGIRCTEYRIDGGTWRNYAATQTFYLTEEGEHSVHWYSEDNVGNVETVISTLLWVDNTPPATTFEPATGPYSLDTVFTLTAADGGSGVNVTRYRIDGGAWTTYSGSFTLTEGTHNVSFYSMDMLDNKEAERWREVTISGEPPPEVEANYKPVVAVIFAIILLIAGLWSSRRRPWKGGEDGMAVAKAFTVTTMPFVIVETMTGVVSYLTGELSIPPSLGLGTILDAFILAIGLMILAARAVRKDHTNAKVSGNESE